MRQDDGGFSRTLAQAFHGPDQNRYVVLVRGPAEDWPSTYPEIAEVAGASFCPDGSCRAG